MVSAFLEIQIILGACILEQQRSDIKKLTSPYKPVKDNMIYSKWFDYFTDASAEIKYPDIQENLDVDSSFFSLYMINMLRSEYPTDK